MQKALLLHAYVTRMHTVTVCMLHIYNALHRANNPYTCMKHTSRSGFCVCAARCGHSISTFAFIKKTGFMEKHPPRSAQSDLFKNDLDNMLQQDTQDLREMFSSSQPDTPQPQRGSEAKDGVSADVLRQRLHQRVRQAKRDLQTKHNVKQASPDDLASTNQRWAETRQQTQSTAPTAPKMPPASKVVTWLKIGVVLCVLFVIGIGAGWAALKLPIMRPGAKKQQPISSPPPQGGTLLTTPATPPADAITPSSSRSPSGNHPSAESLGDAQTLKREESIALKRFFSLSNQHLQRSLDDAAQLTQQTDAAAPPARNDGLRPNPLRLGMVGPNHSPPQQQPAPAGRRQQHLAGKPNPAAPKALPNAIRSNAKRLSKHSSSGVPVTPTKHLGSANPPAGVSIQPAKKRLNTQKTTFVSTRQAQPKPVVSPMPQTRQQSKVPKAYKASALRPQQRAQKTTFVSTRQAQPKPVVSPMPQTRQQSKAPKAYKASALRPQQRAQKTPPQPTKRVVSPMPQTRQQSKAPKAYKASALRPQQRAQKTPPQPTKRVVTPVRKPAAKPAKTWLLQVGACQAKKCIADYRKVLARQAPNRSILVTEGKALSYMDEVRVQRIQVMVPSKQAGMQLKNRLKSHDSRFGYAYLIAPSNANLARPAKP